MSGRASWGFRARPSSPWARSTRTWARSAEASSPYQLLKVMGTSTCDVLLAPRTEKPETLVPGICGQVDGSVLPGAIGYEAGQSAFGDVYAWFKKLLCWPLGLMPAELGPADPAARERLITAWTDRIIPELERAALAIPPGEAPCWRSTG